MADVVNLRRARKAKARQAAEAAAEANRLASGRSKSERQTTEIERNLALRHIEGHRLPHPREQSPDADPFCNDEC